MKIKPRGFTRNIKSDVRLYVNDQRVYAVAKPGYAAINAPGVPQGMRARRWGTMVWTPTPPPAGAHAYMIYTLPL